MKITIVICLSAIFIAACDQSLFQDKQPADVFVLEDGLAYSNVELEEAELSTDDNYDSVDFGNLESQLAGLSLGGALLSDGRSHIEGEWSASYPWPLSPIHAALLPDGSVLSYGAGAERLKNGRAFDIDRWNPSMGFSQSAHEFTPTGSSTNIFCSAQSVLTNGNVLISGGDKQGVGPVVQGIKNEGIKSSTLYNSSTGAVSDLPDMRFARWYPTLVTLANGSQLALGGRAEKNDGDSNQVVPIVPEMYVPRSNRWRVLWGARNEDFYKGTWVYPRSFLNNRGTVTVFSNSSTDIHELTPVGRGSFDKVGQVSPTFGRLGAAFPAAMYRPGRVLAMSRTGRMASININDAVPTSSAISQSSGIRFWGNTTVLADGTVFLVGGARQRQNLNTAVHFGEIWDPEHDTWKKTRESRDKKARLYHSISLLMPDASVLVAGGGPPGPTVNMNADVFYPPYLFDSDGSGDRAPRPSIDHMEPLLHGTTSNVVMSNAQPISRVTLVRSGSVTHAFDSSQRFMDLPFSQSGSVLAVDTPGNRHSAPPGLYMLFAFNDHGVPSVAELQLIE